ncbi:hypothetical protein D3C86_1735580 [compost metagenome]
MGKIPRPLGSPDDGFAEALGFAAAHARPDDDRPLEAFYKRENLGGDLRLVEFVVPDVVGALRLAGDPGAERAEQVGFLAAPVDVTVNPLGQLLEFQRWFHPGVRLEHQLQLKLDLLDGTLHREGIGPADPGPLGCLLQ